MTPMIKKIVIAAIILVIIVACVLVYSKWKKQRDLDAAAAAKQAFREELGRKDQAISTESTTAAAPKGTPGGKGNPIG